MLRPYKEMLPFKVVYHEKYDLNLGPHVFPSQKFRLIAEALLAEKIATREDFAQPQPATDEDILRVHSREYVHKLKSGGLSYLEILRMEVPYSKELIEAVLASASLAVMEVADDAPGPAIVPTLDDLEASTRRASDLVRRMILYAADK